MTVEVVRWHTDEGAYIALAERGRTRLHLLRIGYPMHMEGRPINEVRWCKPVDVPPKRAIRKFKQIARNNATTAVHAFLKRAQA
jgi:hypothetical protein